MNIKIRLKNWDVLTSNETMVLFKVPNPCGKKWNKYKFWINKKKIDYSEKNYFTFEMKETDVLNLSIIQAYNNLKLREKEYLFGDLLKEVFKRFIVKEKNIKKI